MRQPERRALARAKILDAAIDQLAAQGYAATSVQSVARASGKRIAALQHHFPTKVDLMAAVVERFSQNALEYYRAGLLGVTGPRERLRRMNEISWDVSQSPELLASSEIALARRGDPALVLATDPVFRRFDRLTRRWVRGLARQAGMDLALSGSLHRLNNIMFQGFALQRASGTSVEELLPLARMWGEMTFAFHDLKSLRDAIPELIG